MPDPLPAADSPRRPAPRGFQYGLKSLFIFTTIAAGLTALAGMISTVALVAVVWFLLLVVAHVAGNAWGRRQQDKARTPSELDEGPPRATSNTLHRFERPGDARLGRHANFGRSMVFTVTVAAVAGLAAGALFVIGGGVPQWNFYGLIVASLSAGVLGGVLGFLLSGCLRVLAQAVVEASDAASGVGSGK